MGRPRTRRGRRTALAEGLRAARATLGLTQRQAAKLLGVHQVTIAKYEADMKRPRGLALRGLEEWIARTLKGGRDA